MLARLWRLLNHLERRQILTFLPLMALSAVVEIVSVAAVIPFLSMLADPASVGSLPIVGEALVRIGGGDPVRTLRITGLLLASAIVLANVLHIFVNWWLFRFIYQLNHSLSSRLLRNYLSRPYSFLLTRNTSEMSNKIMVEVQRLTEDGFRSAVELITRPPIVIGLVGFLFILDPLTAAVSILCLGSVYGTIFVSNRSFLRRIGSASVSANLARMKAVNEALGGFVDLRVLGRELSAHREYESESRKFARTQTISQAISKLPRYALEAVAVAGLILIASLLAGSGARVAETLPLLGAFAFAGLRLMPPMQVIFYAAARMRYASGPLEAIEADFEVQFGSENLEVEEPPALDFNDSITLRDISFSYPGNVPALTDLALSIRKKEMLAIVGRTGAGKTTLVDLLLGLLTPDTGEILVDDAVVTKENIRSYRRLFGYVPQSIFLMDDTIRRNVALGVPEDEIDDEQVFRACREAQIHEFIEFELPAGYATLVGERGIRLSGGQRQRIGIARALYHQPEVLVFDEATSALDVHTEKNVYGALAELAKDITVLTIAHRLNTVMQADRVIVLEHGRIVAHGTPAEVVHEFEVGAVG